ncbi:MAG: EAL domain-containing protein [Sphingomonas sp.]|nr:EAL domain-containing protein [Sphingomonas sp.]
MGQVRQLATIWPFALFAHVATAFTIGLLTFLSEDLTRIRHVFTQAGAMMVLSLVMLVLLALRSRTAQQQIRVAVVVGIGQAVLVGALLWETQYLPGQNSQTTAAIAALGAISATGIALYPVRAALFGFCAALTAMVFVLVGPTTGALIASGCLFILAVATRRMALLDVAQAQKSFTDPGNGVMAERLIREFETQGTGWFWQTDRDGRLTYLSEKVAEVMAEAGHSPIGSPLTDAFQMDTTAPGTERTLGFHLSSRTGFSDYTVRPAMRLAVERWWSISGRPVIDDAGRFQGFIGSGADLTEKRRAEAEITRLALYDGLTGLANRQRMRASLDQSLNQPVGPYRPTTLFLLDLDRFKAVNDTLGHQTGDALLKQVAQRLLRAVGDAGLVGRLGGDEFQVILPGENEADRLPDLAREIIGSLSQPYSIGGNTISIGCSIGVAIAPQDGRDSETLVRNADLALYAAKADGRGVHRFYREELLQGAKNRKQMEDDLRHALVQNQFHLVYQPVVCTESARLVGFEALLRWEHPDRGPISPADFIPVAEDCGMIEQIGEWVLRTACLEAAKWPSHVRVGVNVSTIQFANPALPSIIANAIARAGIPASRLELEITESVFLDESDSADAMFKALKGLGVRLALDDFGTGYSSLGYLKSAPFDKIKIDQSFVRGAAITDSRNAPIIHAIVTLASTLGMETTAEGVETLDEIELIRTLGCSHIQGYVYGKPVRAPDVLVMLRDGNGIATPLGYRTSRPPRLTLMRNALIAIGQNVGEVRLRNISASGAMIDGLDFNRDPVGVAVRLEIIEGEQVAATIRWARDGKVGLEFAKRFDIERLNTVVDPMRFKKAG